MAPPRGLRRTGEHAAEFPDFHLTERQFDIAVCSNLLCPGRTAITRVASRIDPRLRRITDGCRYFYCLNPDQNTSRHFQSVVEMLEGMGHTAAIGASSMSFNAPQAD